MVYNLDIGKKSYFDLLEVFALDLEKAKEIFYVAKKSENVTDRTLETYEEVIPRFLKYLGEENILDIRDVRSIHIREYLVTLREKGLRGITSLKHFRCIRTFFLFLEREDCLNKNPLKNVKPPKPEQKEMRTFNAQEVNKILNFFDRNDFFGMRNYCIMCLFFSTGIRKGEVTDLTLDNIDNISQLIRIEKGKGQKARSVPIGKKLRYVLKQYLGKREDYLNGESCEWLFVSRRPERKMTKSCISVLFQKLKKNLGLTGEKVSAHTWRHTHAKNYLLNGGDIFSLQKILGHADIATTRKYINLDTRELKSQHAKFNPLDNRAWED